MPLLDTRTETSMTTLGRRLAQALRHRADRRALAEMDAHHLPDIGLRPGDVRRVLPSQPPPPLPDFERRGAMTVRGWTLKLYVPHPDRAALRPEDHSVAERALGAILAGPGSVTGFAVLRRMGGAGMLGLSAWWWEGPCLEADAVALPPSGPPHRRPGTRLDTSTIGLLARECAAWRRLVLEAAMPDIEAYLREDCA